ncbi:MAG: RHS repeat protein, partial [Actinobacteria bacterium]|nr:RHS repeat protein [Actinomycetota bacterium]
MSDERVSARPANLAKFVAASRQINDEIKARVAAVQAGYDRFQAGGYEHNVANPDLWADLATYQRNNVSDETFVETVRQAFVRADSDSPVVNARARTIQRNFDIAAKRTGATDTGRLTVTVDDPIVTGRPPSSGFSDDPVCTATGHFLEEENDLTWPARLTVLRWRRTYSSRHIAAGPLGRGWSCWANARCTRDGDAVAYHGPDGQVAVLTANPDGSWGPIPGLAAHITEDDTSGLVMAWRPASARPGQVWHFDPDGLPHSVTGPGLGTTRFIHTGGLLTAIRHDGGRQLQLEWYGAHIVAVRSSCGRRTTYRYDDRGDLVGVQRPLGAVTYAVDEGGRILEVVDADGVQVCVNTYDGEGRVRTQRSPFGRLTRFRYEPGGVTVVDDDQGGPRTTFTHDFIGRLSRLENHDGERLERVFDDHGNCMQETTFSGATTAQAFDERGNRVANTGPDGAEDRWEYDERGRVVRITGPEGYAVRFDYDGEESHPVRMFGDDGWELRFELTGGGQVCQVTDADGVTASLEHDTDGNLVAVTDGSGHTTRYSWHPSGQLAELILPDGAMVRAERDDAGWCQRVTSPPGHTWTFERSLTGRILAIIEPDGARTELNRGEAGEITEMIDAVGSVIRLRYDQLQNLVGVAGPDEIKWQIDYDALGRLSVIHEPTGGLRRYNHNPEGRVVGVTGPDGHRLTRQFDLAGREIELIDRSGGVSNLNWDQGGRLVRRSFPDNTAVALAWDRWNRPTSITQPDGGTVTMAYTFAGRPRSTTSAEGRTTTFTWDAAGRLAAITDDLGHATRYHWDPCGRLVEVTFPSGRWERFGYDSDGRLTIHERDGRVWR